MSYLYAQWLSACTLEGRQELEPVTSYLDIWPARHRAMHMIWVHCTLEEAWQGTLCSLRCKTVGRMTAYKTLRYCPVYCKPILYHCLLGNCCHYLVDSALKCAKIHDKQLSYSNSVFNMELKCIFTWFSCILYLLPSPPFLYHIQPQYFGGTICCLLIGATATH